MKKPLVLLAFFGISVFVSFGANAATRYTFYKDYDPRVVSKEQYLAKLESKEMRATREEIRYSARFAFRRDFVSWAEYREFVRSEEVTVAPCTFTDAPVDYLELRPRRQVAQQRRDHRKGELCLRHQGGDRISLLCGQGIMDPRRVLPAPPPVPKPAEKPKEMAPPEPRKLPPRISGPIRTAEKGIIFDECLEYGVVTTVIPSPGFNAGVYGRGSFAGMTFDGYTTQQQAFCLRYR